MTLVAAAFAAGFVDAIAGGGGLITLPALTLAGLDPVSAIATNKLQGSFGAGSAMRTYARAGHLEWSDAWPLALLAGLGGVAGALLVSHVPLRWLAVAMPFALILIALYFGLSPKLSDVATRPRMGVKAFTLTMAPLVGFYDGVFGPGAGSFYMLGFVALLGFGNRQGDGLHEGRQFRLQSCGAGDAELHRPCLLDSRLRHGRGAIFWRASWRACGDQEWRAADPADAGDDLSAARRAACVESIVRGGPVPLYQRISALPQAMPPPIAIIAMRSPFFRRPARLASSSEIGSDALDVLP